MAIIDGSIEIDGSAESAFKCWADIERFPLFIEIVEDPDHAAAIALHPCNQTQGLDRCAFVEGLLDIVYREGEATVYHVNKEAL